MPVDPARSANTTVTVLRAPVAVDASSATPTGAPQASQKRAPGPCSASHVVQRSTSRSPHDAQKRAPSRFASPQLPHTMPMAPPESKGYGVVTQGTAATAAKQGKPHVGLE